MLAKKHPRIQNDNHLQKKFDPVSNYENIRKNILE